MQAHGSQRSVGPVFWIVASVVFLVLVFGAYAAMRAFDSSSSSKNSSSGEIRCVARIQGNSVVGSVNFYQSAQGARVSVSAEITGLTAGLHGIHIHEFGDTSNGCLAAGAHFNPLKMVHGAPGDEIRHVGDLGNISVDETGRGVLEIEDRMLSLRGERSIIGRTVVIHSGTDDLGRGNDAMSLTTGNAGQRVACGVIGIAPL
eukprot:TRINITY_DN15276_c0_g1_i1.p1 TRINITY_DN15276_c0_g1~~TRINITY_DN15276_c0_g1_i1.p1  ORF type:complete len:202 (+),score=23.92 TRINITY_DN15276_c0_g1_i1:28-633(+)